MSCSMSKILILIVTACSSLQKRWLETLCLKWWIHRMKLIAIAILIFQVVLVSHGHHFSSQTIQDFITLSIEQWRQHSLDNISFAAGIRIHKTTLSTKLRTSWKTKLYRYQDFLTKVETTTERSFLPSLELDFYQTTETKPWSLQIFVMKILSIFIQNKARPKKV